MISSLIKQVMAATGLKQAALAIAIGVSLDRVKSLSSGKAKKLKPEEMQALVENLHVRPEFLATGRGDPLLSAAEQQFEKRLSLIRKATQRATSLELPRDYQELVRDILLGLDAGSSDQVREAIDLFLVNRVARRLLPESLGDERDDSKGNKR